MKSLTIILTFSIIDIFSHATSSLITHSQLQMNQYSMLNHTQQQIIETEQVSGSSCSYKIDIKTSCSSPDHKDPIDIIIGDANGNQIISSPDPNMGGFSFKPCMMIPFEIHGKCIGKICSMFFVRVGVSGWMPESATLYYSDYPPVTFKFNYSIPWGIPSGITYCTYK